MLNVNCDVVIYVPYIFKNISVLHFKYVAGNIFLSLYVPLVKITLEKWDCSKNVGGPFKGLLPKYSCVTFT